MLLFILINLYFLLIINIFLCVFYIFIDFNGAMLKAVCVEAGMHALRRGGTFLTHEDYVDGIAAVQAKKKTSLNYYA